MRFLLPTAYTVTAATLVFVVSGCTSASRFTPPGTNLTEPSSSSSSDTVVSATNRIPWRNATYSVRNGTVSLVPPNFPLALVPKWARFAARDADHGSKEVLWAAGETSSNPIGEYAVPDKSNNGPICETPDVSGVNNLGIDLKGNLWVPSANNGPVTGFTQEYNCNGGIGSMIPDKSGQPSDVAFDSKGNIYVGNVVDFYGNGFGNYIPVSGTADVYNSGGTWLGVLSDPTFFAPHVPGYIIWNSLTGIAVDAHDNCYLAHQDNTGGGEVVEFPGCKPARHGKVLGGPHPWNPGKPEFDSADNLIISDFASFGYYSIWYVSIYAPPYDKPALRSFPLYGPAISCPLSLDQARVYCGNFINGTIDVYAYKTGTYLYSFNNGLQTYGVDGLALAPAGLRLARP